MKRSLNIFMVFFLVLMASAAISKEFIIFSITQSLPMGEPNEVVKKNYYVNFGENQGIKNGDKLDVYRIISRLDPYKSKKRYNYRVKIGQIKVIHTEANSAIASLDELNNSEDSPMLEIDGLMIGDHVNVQAD